MFLFQHNLLVSEVISQLQLGFQPAPALIKQRIQDLIEREYMKRSPGDREIYIYVP